MSVTDVAELAGVSLAVLQGLRAWLTGITPT